MEPKGSSQETCHWPLYLSHFSQVQRSLSFWLVTENLEWDSGAVHSKDEAFFT